MAIVASNLYSGRVITGDTGYPLGKAQDILNGEKGTGTPLRASWVNDQWGFLQALLDAADITPSGTPDQVGQSDYLDAVNKLIREPLALKIFQSPSSEGLTEIQTRTVDAGEVFEVRKTSDGSLATIYSDAAGTTEIVQNGTDNKSGSDGVVEFYIADGDYYVEVGGVRSGFLVSTLKQFKTVAEMIESNLINLGDVVSTRGFYEAGEGSAKYVVTSQSDAIARGYTIDGYSVILLDSGFVAIYSSEDGSANAEQIGAVANNLSSDAVNGVAIGSAIANNIHIIVDSSFYVKPANIEYQKEGNVRISGAGSIILTGVGSVIVLTAATDASVSGVAITSHDTVVGTPILFFGGEDLEMESVSFDGCHISGSVRLVSTNFNPSIDPVSGYGIKKFKILRNTFRNVSNTVFRLVDMPCEELIVHDNDVNNFDNRIVYSPHTRDLPFSEKIKDAKGLCTYTKNRVIADDDFFGEPSSYFTPILFDGREVYQANNIFENNKCLDYAPIYDGYFYVDNIVSTGNLWKNNMAFAESKQYADLMKSKQALYRYYKNNTYIVEESFVLANGGSKDTGYVNIGGQDVSGGIFEVSGNTFNLYSVKGEASSEQYFNMLFSGNLFKAKYASGAIIYSNSSDDSLDYRNADVTISNNDILIESDSGLGFQIYRHSSVHGDTDDKFYNSVNINNNNVVINNELADPSNFAFTRDEPSCSFLNIKNNSITYSGDKSYSTSSSIITGETNLTRVKTVADISGNTIYCKGSSNMYRIPVLLDGNCNMKFKVSAHGELTVDNQNSIRFFRPESETKHITVSVDIIAGGDTYSGYFSLTISPTQIKYVNTSGENVVVETSSIVSFVDLPIKIYTNTDAGVMIPSSRVRIREAGDAMVESSITAPIAAGLNGWVKWSIVTSIV